MTEDQLELNEKREALFQRFTEVNPEISKALLNLLDTVYSDGALSGKMKYLLALAIALGTGCRICTLAQLTKALEAGATRGEIMETLSVCVAMRGTTGTAESLRVIEYLDQKGIL